jgi:hypothetical protein
VLLGCVSCMQVCCEVRAGGHVANVGTREVLLGVLPWCAPGGVHPRAHACAVAVLRSSTPPGPTSGSPPFTTAA